MSITVTDKRHTILTKPTLGNKPEPGGPIMIARIREIDLGGIVLSTKMKTLKSHT